MWSSVRSVVRGVVRSLSGSLPCPIILSLSKDAGEHGGRQGTLRQAQRDGVLHSDSRLLAKGAKCLAIVGCLIVTLGGMCGAETASIFKMPVNNRIWEVYEVNPLTSVSDGEVARAWVSPNGANIAYVTVTPEASRLCVKESGGSKAKVIAVAGRDPGAVTRSDGDRKTRWDLDQLNLVWSSDSRLVAFPVFDDEPIGESVRTKDWTWIVTFTKDGEQKSSFPLPRALELVGDLAWNHDVRKIAMVVRPQRSSGLRVASSESKETVSVSSSILLLDLFAGSAKPIYTQPNAQISLLDWSKGGKALRFTAPVENGAVQLMELDVDTGKATIIEQKQSAEIVTDDWDYRLLTTETGLALENRRNSKRIAVCRDPNARFLGWTPNDLLILSRPSPFSDDTGERKQDLTSLWLSRPLQPGVSAMCIALDFDPRVKPTFSQDSSVVAFVSHGRLWAARINRRDATLEEKAAYRMVLDKEEEKNVALARGTLLAKALSDFAAANQGKFPAKESVTADLKPYLSDPQAFNKPGSLQQGFRYNPPDTSVVTGQPVDLGSIDTSGPWRVVVSSDGKARLEGK